MDKCETIRIVITSRKPINNLIQSAEPEIIILESLKPEQSVDLFLEHAGDFGPDDIYDLILKDENFQPNILDSSLGKKLPNQVPPETRKKMLNALR